jgi:hypothetical protein
LRHQGIQITSGSVDQQGTVSCDELDKVGLAAGAGLLKQSPDMSFDRGVRDAQHRCNLGNAADLDDGKQEIRGEGVVGEQPVLGPGERFEYTSGVPLPTASGFMAGRYQMVSESGEHFEIDVPAFSLDSPDSKRVLN